jgi:hypothetical protein
MIKTFFLLVFNAIRILRSEKRKIKVKTKKKNKPRKNIIFF